MSDQNVEQTVISGAISTDNVIGDGIAIGHGAHAYVTHHHYAAPPPLETEQTRHNRAVMLQKVHDFWIRGVLENSLHTAALIDLGMVYQPDAVAYPWEAVIERLDAVSYALPPATSIASVFDTLGGELLILGAPGSGKTTMLLELARVLIARAQQDSTQPIPVVFNLTSWAKQRPPLGAWLVEELNVRYAVPRTVGQAWIDHDQVLPLLDGLDEVHQDYRADCVATINAYRQEHGFLGMAVCSRVADYDLLTVKLTLRSALVLQPLTATQIDAYLEQAGDQLVGVRTLLRADAEIQELAQTPLMLHIMILAYQGMVFDDLPDRVSIEERRRHLFDTYIERMLKRRGGVHRYTRTQTTHWLTWLAQQMVSHQQTVFYLDHMQPHWLHRWWQHGLYLFFSAIGSGVCFAVAGAVIWVPILVWWSIPSFVQNHHLSNALLFDVWFGSLLYGLFSGVVGLITGLLVSLGHYTNGRHQRWQMVSYAGIGFALLSALSVVSGRIEILWIILLVIPYAVVTGMLVDQGRIQPADVIHWSWAKLISHWHIVSSVVVSVMLLYIVPYVLIYKQDKTLLDAVFIGMEKVLMYALIFGVSIGLVFGQRRVEIQEKKYPNEAIWRSLRQAVVVWPFVVVTTAAVVGMTRGEPQGHFVGLVIGCAAGLYAGGVAFVQHFALRCVCTVCQFMPWQYAAFLNEAAEHIFLHKVGGGYIYIHRMLLEYFADMKEQQRRDTTPERSSRNVM